MMTETTILDERAVSEIEARANAASAGPWFWVKARTIQWLHNASGCFASISMPSFNHRGYHHRPTAAADNEFTAHAREDIPALCATVKHLREQKAQAQEDAAYSAKLADEKADEVTREVQRAFAFKQERDRLATGLANLYHVITGKPCDKQVALGMATSAVSSLQSQLEQLRAENERLKSDALKLSKALADELKRQ